ncbi:PAS domain-containing protein [uncultured Bradyrhizobium sp.]|uniref:PAS domain-containing protein n=1 Tax=uncultured Bradyrhizobium sp. TaxID=199684 RepID=UPI0035CBD89C
MQFQRAHVSIVRSIRHVSLVRDWHRARGTRQLPEFTKFVPNERAGDAADLSISDVVREDGKLFYICRQAGNRVEQMYDARMPSRHLSDCLDPGMAAAAKPIWDACVLNQLPVYAIIPLSDRDGCPVTVEQLFLPYAGHGSAAEVMVAALYACSTEGRFAHHGLLRRLAKVPLHWAVIIDPAIAAAPRPARDPVTEIDDVLLNDGVSSTAR